MNKVSLGQKIRSFRKIKNVTQLELENRIGAASGMVSRIENGETNPTKETLLKIRDCLNLSVIQYSYLAGDLAEPPTNEQIDNAIASVQTYFNNPKLLAYLMDDRMRFCCASQGFHNYMNMTKAEVDKNLKGRFMLEMMLNPDLGIKKYIETDKYEETVYYQLVRFKTEVGFMLDDPIYLQALDVINTYPISRKLWPTIKVNDLDSYLSTAARTVKFKMMGFSVKMTFSVEPLRNFDDRFDIVEYVPNNKVLKFLSKL